MRYLILWMALLVFAQAATVEQLFSVETVEVKKVTTAKIQKNYGYVRVDESLRYSVAPRFSGFVETLYADTLYKYVHEGDVLASVYSPEVLSAKEEYLASLKYNKIHKSIEMLESSREKLLLLNVSPKEIKSIEESMKVSKQTDISAPKSGYVFAKNISHLDAFKATQKLFEIVSLERVWVEMQLYQKELATLDALDSFKFKVIGIEDSFEAKKEILYPMLNTKETTLTLRLSVNNKKNLLKAGMYVTIESHAKAEEYLMLPSTAVLRKNGVFYAFVAGEYEGEYEQKEIEVKVLDAKRYSVIRGLKEGDVVVNNALFLMDSDAQINGTY